MNKDPPKSLFVTNLPYSLDLEDFKSYFTKFGPVERFDIPDHPNKPIAFVHFQNSEDAAKCLKENNGILYRGKILCIKFSSKAKPEHAPPLSSSVKSDADTSSSIDKPENESYSKHYDHDEIRSNSRRRRHEGNYNDYESRRRNPSPDYEFDRRRDPYSKYDYIDKPRDRIPYRDRIPREPPYYRERDMDYYYDDYRRDYPNYRHHRPSNEHRDRDTMRGYHERELRDERELREQREIRDQRDMDYYDYQYSAQPSSHQVSQSQLPKTIPYNVSQSSPIMSQTSTSSTNQQSLPSPLKSIPVIPQQINDLMQIDPRSQISMRSQQLPPPLPPPPPQMQPSSRSIPSSSSIQQSQQQQYDYNDNRYYNTYQ